MSAWLWWLVIAGVLGVGEMLTLALILGMTAIAALVAAIVAGVGGGPLAQLAAFAATSVALLLGLRPVARRHLTQSPAVATGIDALIGKVGVVLESVDGADGRVKIGGEVWSARVTMAGQTLEPGTSVRVLRIDGATAVVHPAELWT
ncbi:MULTISPECIES: NfeD family protein [unclassified Frankia]|uniref:NfeD family protein n=1 Tax=unclassified Frankia TaxID=2632575 RepID=UPI002AD5A3AB|nr:MULTISPECIES: NfeD family protein [unclassified Frankia]